MTGGIPEEPKTGALLAQAVFAFLVLPGTVAYVIPLLLASQNDHSAVDRWIGAVVIAIGTVLLLWCVRDFYTAGKGTLAPWTPPRNLVRTGLYRRSRNPMYVAVLLVVLGWSAWFSSAWLLIYAGCLAVAFHLRTRLYEEPRLEASFGEEWLDYKKSVPRWLIR